jgi:hypothetical protein
MGRSARKSVTAQIQQIVIHSMVRADARKAIKGRSAKTHAHLIDMAKVARKCADARTVESAITFLASATAKRDFLDHCKELLIKFQLLV